MKKILFFATAFVALAACTDDAFIGDQNLNIANERGTDQIVFGPGLKRLTRGDDHVGADAADLLGNKFIVGGFKGGSSADGVSASSGVSTVFDNYIVNWEANTAATTESNTSDWEYVGITAAAPATVTGLQTIKYWDFSASQYDFIAYSVGKGNTLVAKTTTTIADGTPTTGNVWVTPITPSTAKTSAYQLRGLKADLLKCYIADMKTITKGDYKKEVQLDFRRLASKVRIALYETVPGYSVKEVKFYAADGTPIDSKAGGYVAPTATATLFVSGSGANVFNNSGKYTISFPTIGTDNSANGDYNQAHVTFTADATGGTGTTETFGSLNYGAKERNEATDNIYLGRASNAASYAGVAGDNYYQYVLPNEDGAVVELRVDYTLLSVDGSGEEIKIYGAKAYVPAAFTKWNSNFAYTYIFKISDNTNGWTSQVTDDPEGLYPITFDAVITEAENYNSQATITTVATPSITTYQKGHDISKNEYSVLATDPEIYVQVIAAGTLKTDLNTKGQLYTLDKAATEAEVMDALNIQASSTSTTITGRNELVLTQAASTVSASGTFTTIPCIDGNTITVADGTAAKFTPVAPESPATVKYYAYVYDATPSPAPASTYYYSANALTAKPSDWETAGVWYKDPDGANAVGDYADGTYYKKYTNLNKVYGVKVIKVVP